VSHANQGSLPRVFEAWRVSDKRVGTRDTPGRRVQARETFIRSRDDLHHTQSTVNVPAHETAVPALIRTARLLLRSWQSTGADELLPILEANWDYLSPWIPARVATPAPVPQLGERLAGCAAKFEGNAEWRYAIFRTRDQNMLGEVSLFPRSATGRVPLAEADRAELGYWLRADENGQGFATEATAAVLAVAKTIQRFTQFEIRCDARNLRSAAVPRRLDFQRMTPEPDGTDLYWLRRDGFPEEGSRSGFDSHVVNGR